MVTKIQYIRKIQSGPPDSMSIPPRWVMSNYLSLEPPRQVNIGMIKERFGSDGMAWQFVRLAEKHGLLVRTARGKYVIIDPDIAVRAFALDNYYRDLLVIDNALKILEKKHAFLCLSAHEYTDYLPEKIMPVLLPEEPYPRLDALGFVFKGNNAVKLSVFDRIVEIPILSRADTALLLLSTYLPREVIAGRSILKDIPMTKTLVRKLKFLGYSDYGIVPGVDNIKITLPRWLIGKKERYAENRIKLEAARV